MQEHKENNGMYVCVKEQAGVVRKEGWLVGWLVGWLEKKRARGIELAPKNSTLLVRILKRKCKPDDPPNVDMTMT